MNFRYSQHKVNKEGVNIIIVFFCLFILLLSGCTTLPQPDFSPEEPNVVVVNYNVNYAVIKPQNVINFLSEIEAEVICLQETNKIWESILNEDLKQKYPHTVFQDFDYAGGGIAILSRHLLDNTIIIEPDDGWFPAIYTNVNTAVGTVQILNVHLRPPITRERSVSISALFAASKMHVKEIQDFIKRVDIEKPLIVAGDFNESENGKAMKWLLSQGFKNSLSEYDKNITTWKWKLLPLIYLKYRFDHILFNEYLRCSGAKVVNVNASDHMPVISVFTLNR